MDPLGIFLKNSKLQVLIPADQQQYKLLLKDPHSFQNITNPKHFYHGQDVKMVLLLASKESSNQNIPTFMQDSKEEPPFSVISLFNQIHIFIEAHPLSSIKQNIPLSPMNSPVPNASLGSPCPSILSHWSLNPNPVLNDPYITVVDFSNKPSLKPKNNNNCNPLSPSYKNNGCFCVWSPDIKERPVKIFKHKGAWAGLYPITFRLGSGGRQPTKETLQLGFLVGRPKPPQRKTQYKWTLPGSYLLNSSRLETMNSLETLSSSSSDEDQPDSNFQRGIAFGALDDAGKHYQNLMLPGKMYQYTLSMGPSLEAKISTSPQNQTFQTQLLVTVSLTNKQYSPNSVTLENISLSSNYGSLTLATPKILPMTLSKNEEAKLIFYYDLKMPFSLGQNNITSPMTLCPGLDTKTYHEISIILGSAINQNKRSFLSNYRLELDVSCALANFPTSSCIPQPPFSPVAPIENFSDKPSFHQRNFSSTSSGAASSSSGNSKTSHISASSVLGRFARNLSSLVPPFSAIPSFGEVLGSPTSALIISPTPMSNSQWQSQDEMIFTLQVDEDIKLGDPCQLQVTVLNKSPKTKLLSLFFPSNKTSTGHTLDIEDHSLDTTVDFPDIEALFKSKGLGSPNFEGNKVSDPFNEESLSLPFWGLSSELALSRYIATHAMFRLGGVISNQGGRLVVTRPIIPFAKLSPGACQSIMVPLYPLSHLSTGVSPLGIIDHDQCRVLSLSSALPLLEILPSY